MLYERAAQNQVILKLVKFYAQTFKIVFPETFLTFYLKSSLFQQATVVVLLSVHLRAHSERKNLIE